MTSPHVWVVIPARNEEATIGRLVEELKNYADVVIVANDSSNDNTAAVASHAGAAVVDVPPSRRGLAGVYRYGLQAALEKVQSLEESCIIVEMDAGGSHSPSDLPKFLEPFVGDRVDVVFGRRFGPDAKYQGHYKRALLSLGGTLLYNLLWGTEWADATSGFIAYRPSVLQFLLNAPWRSEGHYYQTEVRHQVRALGFRTAEVPITYRNSSSSLNWRSILEAWRLL